MSKRLCVWVCCLLISVCARGVPLTESDFRADSNDPAAKQDHSSPIQYASERQADFIRNKVDEKDGNNPSQQELPGTTGGGDRVSDGSESSNLVEMQQCPGRPFCGAQLPPHQAPSTRPPFPRKHADKTSARESLSVQVMVLTFNVGAADNLVSRRLYEKTIQKQFAIHTCMHATS
jgi:hypothetical protein